MWAIQATPEPPRSSISAVGTTQPRAAPWPGGEEHQVGPQHRRHPAQQVEGQEAPVPQGVLDVAAEDPQIEQHVARQVLQAAMQEHGAEQGQGPKQELRRRRGLAQATEPARHQAVVHDEQGLSRRGKHDLVQKYRQVDAHEQYDCLGRAPSGQV